MTTTVSTIFAQGYAALESENLDGVRAAMDEAAEAGIDGGDVRLGYLQFMCTWLDEESSEEELEQIFAGASMLLTEALQLEIPGESARIVLDLADLLAQAGDFDDAEHALRALSQLEGVADDSLGAACMLRASILLDHHEDPAEALEVLEGAPAPLREDPGYLSLLAATLLDLERPDQAVEVLETALARKDDTEIRYQLGVALRDVERADHALEHLLEVRRRDLAAYEVDLSQPVDDEEVEDLRRRVEDVLDTLPDPVIAKLASAPIRVERWASVAAVEGGADPRAPLAFLGEVADADGEGKVEALVVYRDAIVAQIDDDDEIADVIALGLVEEFDRFFDLELVPGE